MSRPSPWFLIEPQDGEILSSWLVRLAGRSGYTAQDIARLWLGDPWLWSKDIDLFPNKSRLSAFSSQFGFNLERILGATLLHRDNARAGGLVRGVLSMHMRRQGTAAGLMFCPSCLKDDAEPHFRANWRLATTMICARHLLWLIDACPRCQSRILPHLAPIGRLATCWNCYFDLRLASASGVEEDDFSGLAYLEAQRAFELPGAWGDGRRLMLDRIAAVWRVLLSGVGSRRLRELSRPRGTSAAFTSDQKILELAPMALRAQVLPVTALLTQDWPMVMAGACQRSGLTKRSILSLATRGAPAEAYYELASWLPGPIDGAKRLTKRQARMAFNTAFTRINWSLMPGMILTALGGSPAEVGRQR